MHCKHSTKRPAVGALFALAMAGTATCAIGQGVPLPAIEQVIEFKPGTAKARAALAKVASVRDLIAGEFLFAGVDLNDDGRKEILVMGSSSTSCGSGGCLLVVLEQQGNKVVTLLSQNVPNSLGVTKEKIGAYRALVALDQQGAIAIVNNPGTPLHGKPMVYPAAGAATARPSIDPASADRPGNPVRETPAAAAKGDSIAEEKLANIVGVRLRMTAAEAEATLRRHASAHAGTMRVEYGPALFATFKYRSVGTGFRYFLAATKSTAPATAGVSTERIEVTLSPPPDVQRVTSITRSVEFDGAIAPQSVLDQLTTRHGRPSYTFVATSYWFLDNEHRSRPVPTLPWRKASPGPAHDSGVSMICTNIINSPGGVKDVIQGSLGALSDSTRAEGGMANECGTVYALRIDRTSTGTATSVHSSLIDLPTFIKSIAATDAFLKPQAEAAARREQDDARKRGAPKI